MGRGGVRLISVFLIPQPNSFDMKVQLWDSCDLHKTRLFAFTFWEWERTSNFCNELMTKNHPESNNQTEHHFALLWSLMTSETMLGLSDPLGVREPTLWCSSTSVWKHCNSWRVSTALFWFQPLKMVQMPFQIRTAMNQSDLHSPLNPRFSGCGDKGKHTCALGRLSWSA